MLKKLLKKRDQSSRHGLSPLQIRSRMCAREFKSDDRPDLYTGTLLRS